MELDGSDPSRVFRRRQSGTGRRSAPSFDLVAQARGLILSFEEPRTREDIVTLTLDLPGDLRHELEEAAAQRGMRLSDYALELLASGSSSRSATPLPRNGAELVEFWKREGLIGTRPDIQDPVEYARELRERAQTRRG